MPVPYSDNLYSALDDDADADGEQQGALSPADGYFHASSSSDVASSPHVQPAPDSQHQHYPGYPAVPSVPNVLVEDPTLREQDPSAKAREAEEEHRLNTRRSSSSPVASQPQTSFQSQRPSVPGHHHRRSVEDGHPFLYTGQPRQHSPPGTTTSPLETGPLLQPTPSDAPPAYSPRSPASPTSPHSTGQGYQTFGTSDSQPAAMGAPEEQQRLLSREPESMGGAPGGQHVSLWQRAKNNFAFARSNNRKTIQTALLVLLVLSIVAMIAGSFTFGSFDENDGSDNKRNESPGVKDPDPIKRPDLSHGDHRWTDSGKCYNSPHRFPKITSNLDFNPSKNITVVEKISDEEGRHGGRQPHVSGSFVIRPTDGHPSGTLDFEVLSNDKSLSVQAEWDEDDQTFKVITPRKVDWGSGNLWPCIQMRITIWVPAGSILDKLKTEVTHLDIDVIEGLDLSIEDKTGFTTVSGGVTTPKPSGGVLPYKLASRELWIQTVSGDVAGWYPLYDLLYVGTASGQVSVDVAPKEAYSEKPKPAVLDVSSISGDLTIKEPIDAALESKKSESSIPARDYVVKVESTSGDIQADLAFTTSANLASKSGDMRLRLLPVLDSELPGLGAGSTASGPSIRTDTKSGDTKLNLLEPLWTKVQGFSGDDPVEKPGHHDDGHNEGHRNDEPFLIIHPHSNPNAPSLPPSPPQVPSPYKADGTPPLSSLDSKHTSISGTVTLRYPGSWTGRLEAQTLSGGQDYRGEGLRTWKKSGSFPRILEGYKGRGDSYLKVDTISGEQDFLVAEE